MKKYLWVLVLVLFLASCGAEPQETATTNSWEILKKNFLIETKTVATLGKDETIKKSWKITSASDLTVTSQASGRIKTLSFKEGQTVTAGQKLISLEDNIANYGISLERAKNSLERAKISYDSTLLSLEKNITDSKIAYDKAKVNHDILERDTKVKLEKAKYDVWESSLGDTNSKSSLDLQKLQADLEKAKVDYQTSLKNDETTLENFKSNIKTTYNNLNLVYFDLITEADEVFWVSDKNRTLNDEYEIYLWAKNNTEKINLEKQIRDLLVDYESFRTLNYDNIDKNDYSYHLTQIEKRFKMLRDLVDNTKNVLKNSVPSTNLTQSQIDGLFATFWWYGQSVQSINSGFVTLQNSINTFTSTYKENQVSRLENINILEKQVEIARRNLQSWEVTTQSSYERVLLDAENSLKNSLIWVQSAKNNYENALENKEITLRSLKNAIQEAQTSYNEASKNYWKLTITSPISGVISEKFVDVGQELSPGTKVLTIVSNNSTEVELYLSSDEIKFLKVGTSVDVVYSNTNLKAKIDSISSVSSKDFTFKTVVKLQDKVSIIGDFVEVVLPIQLESLLLPINALKILPDNKAIIYGFVNGKIEEKEISLGQTYGDKIEVIDTLEDNFEIILTDIKNFNEEEFTLKKAVQ